jgi:hypothetical protein
MSPREGHLKSAGRILAYLKLFPKAKIIVDKTYLNHPSYPIEDNSNLEGLIS